VWGKGPLHLRTYPDPLWIAGVTVFDKFGTPDHVVRVTTFTTAPMQRDREFTGHSMLPLYASTDQTDLDAIVKVPLVSADADAGLPVTVSRGWLRAALDRGRHPVRARELDLVRWELSMLARDQLSQVKPTIGITDPRS
jgi:uncharacterized protein